MTDVAHIVGSSLGIPQRGSLHIGHLLVKTMFGWQLMTLWIIRVGILSSTLYVFTYI